MKQVGGFDIPVFKHAIKVFIGLPDDVAQTNAAHTDLFQDKQLVHISIKEKDGFYLGYVMHECIHAADFILYNIGANMNSSPDNSEVRAYLAEYIYCKVGETLGFMRYKPRRFNNKKDK